MRERYDAAVADPQLLELRSEIGLVDARLADLLSRVDSGESGELWQRLMRGRLELLACRKANDTPGQIVALGAILDLISQGHTDYRAWAEVQGVLEQRRRLTESERKRLVEQQQTITAEQAMLFANAVLLSVKAHVEDRAILSAIQTDILRLTTRSHDIIDVSTDE